MSTHIERLDFAPTATYDPLEAAIHTNRYLLAKPFCEGKRVLDISCGEGYGSYLMAEHWGAASVAGVDISAEAIAKAKANFSSPRISWHCGDAERVASLFPRASFDVIVSLETIEHISQPEVFLAQLKELLKPGGTLILSCPNDHWYYKDEASSNPFHLHKFHFEEFSQLAENYFGQNVTYSLGVPVSGFGNFPLSQIARHDDLPIANRTMARIHLPTQALIVDGSDEIHPSNCSYFVGIWTSENAPPLVCASLFPLSMDNGMIAAIKLLREDLSLLKNHLRATKIELNITAAEYSYSQQELANVRAELIKAQDRLQELNLVIRLARTLGLTKVRGAIRKGKSILRPAWRKLKSLAGKS